MKPSKIITVILWPPLIKKNYFFKVNENQKSKKLFKCNENIKNYTKHSKICPKN